MESIVEQIIPGLGLGTATNYDIPTETVELEVVEMDLTTENDCRAEIADNGCAAVQSSSARESRNNCVLSQTVRGHLIVSDKCLYFTYIHWGTIISIWTLSFEESSNEYDDPELAKVYRKYISDHSNSLNSGDNSNSFDELSIDK